MKFIYSVIALLILLNIPALSQIKFNKKLDSPSKIIDGIFKVKEPVKDEFETQEQFLKRLPIIDSTKFYYFAIPCETLYNIEDSTLRISFNNVNQFSNEKKVIILIASKETQNKSYKASNVYGREVKVDSYNFKEYYLCYIFPKTIKIIYKGIEKIFDWFDCFKKYKASYCEENSFNIVLEMLPNEAKKLSKNIEAAFKVNFNGKKEFSEDKIEAKINNPVEIYNETYYIDANIQEIYYYNKKTKELIFKVIL